MSEEKEFENVSVLLWGAEDEDEAEAESSYGHFGAPIASKPIPMRNRSLSYSAPINRDIYKTINQSPATTYLSEFFAHRDDTFGPEGFDEGRIVGNYLVGPVVGGGGYGQCRQAYVINRTLNSAKQLPEKVALKIITDPRCFDQFEAEVSIWRRLRHPRILPLVDYCVGANFKIAVSPLIEGGNLQEYLASKGSLKEDEARHIFRCICEGIRYLHHDCKIAHLDVKLENILINNDPRSCVDNMKIYICDFGLSYCAEDKRRKGKADEMIERNDMFCSGSITSLPPEVLSSEASSCSDMFNPSSAFEQKKKQDIWALGVLLYALVCGRLPFYDQFMPRLQHSIINGSYEAPPGHLSDELKQLVALLLSTHYHERPDVSDVLVHAWFKIK